VNILYALANKTQYYLYYNKAINDNIRNGYRLTTIPQESSTPLMEMKKL